MAEKPPNILLVYPDQHRGDWTELNENLPVKTPNFKKLAERGIYFSNAICPSPLCSPSRTCMASGREYDNCDIINNGQNHPLDFPTFYELLRDKAGYHTMTCGKLDLRHAGYTYGSDGQHIVDGVNYLNVWGFSEGIENGGKLNGVRVWNRWPEKMGPYITYLEEKGLAEVHAKDFKNRSYTTDRPTELPDEDYADNWIGRQGIRLIKNAPKDKPWFLQVNFNGPHTPFDVTKSMKERWNDVDFPQPIDCTEYTEKENVGIRQNYSAMVENIDRWIGNFIQEIKDRGELDNTIIVYCSDHGEMLGDHNRKHKGCPYQGAINVPCVIAGPTMQQDKTISTPVATIDLTATYLEMAGLEVPEYMDSMSLKSFIEGQSDEIPRNYVRSGLQSFRVVMDDRYKLVTGFGNLTGLRESIRKWVAKKLIPKMRKRVLTKPVMLFDLKEDPGELNNIAEQRPEIVAKLMKKLVDIRKN